MALNAIERIREIRSIARQTAFMKIDQIQVKGRKQEPDKIYPGSGPVAALYRFFIFRC